MLKKAAALIIAGDIMGILDYGAELSEEVKAGLVELELVKLFVRSKAIERVTSGDEESPVKFAHSYGKTSVSVPDKKWKAKKGKDAMELEAELPEEIFDKLFKIERYAVMQDDFEKQLKKLSQEHRDLVKRYFEHTANQPVVTFPSLPAKVTVIASSSPATNTDDVNP